MDDHRDVASEMVGPLWRFEEMGVTPAVSVIVPTHNRPQLLNEALASLVGQKESRWEAIVVDDASAPPASLGEFGDRLSGRIKVVRHATPQGGAAAKNTGIAHASAPLLAFLDDDDTYAPDYLSRAIDVFERHSEIDVLFMGVSWFGAKRAAGERAYEAAMDSVLAEAQGAVLEADVITFGRPLIPALLRSVPMAFQRPIVRASALRDIGLYEPGCFSWDCDWAVRAALHGQVALLNVGLYQQRVDGHGYSSHGTRELDALMSGIEFRDRLRRDLPPHDRWLCEQFAQACATSRFHLAHYYVRNGEPRQALVAWSDSLRQRFVPRRVKFLGRIAACAVTKRTPPN
jgi:glycosyltransferase involved in cell wall biosynthesis